MTDDNRLDDLEMALAHQEQQIQDMSEMITAQWKEIDRLKARISRLEGKSEDAQQDSGEKSLSATDIAARDKPPHY